MRALEAREILSRPLRFGDPSQIAARDYLRELAAARDKLCYCKRCDGEGVLSSARKKHARLCWCLHHVPPEILRDLGVWPIPPAG